LRDRFQAAIAARARSRTATNWLVVRRVAMRVRAKKKEVRDRVRVAMIVSTLRFAVPEQF
jgi:hypothetical protein